MVPSWGTLGRSWDIRDYKTVRSRLGFYWFFVDFGNPFRKMFEYIWIEKTWLFYICFQVTFSDDFGVWIWVSGIGKSSIWQGRYFKTQLLQKLEFSCSQGHFFMILGGPGTNFHDFCCPGEWLEIWWLLTSTLGHPQILRPFWWVVTRWFLALDSKTLEPETWASDPLDTWPADTMDT